MNVDTMSTIENLEDLDKLISDTCLQRQNVAPYQKWTRVKVAYQGLPRLKQDFEELKQMAQKLIEPPLQYGIYLGPAPGGEREIIVGVGPTRLEVHLANGLKKEVKELAPGQIVVLNEKQNVVAVRDEYATGETAEVVNIITLEGEAKVLTLIEAQPPLPAQVAVRWRENEDLTVPCSEELVRQGMRPGDIVQIMQVDQDQRIALPRARPRLHVKAGGSEGTVVEISERLHRQDVKIGDIVRIEPGLKFAFEKLPAYETGELTLEEVPDVTYDDIGGLDEQIGQIYDAIELPYLFREEFEQYQLTRPKGILLYGPPGCGKTMVAKAVANSLTQNIRRHLQNLEQHMVLYQELKRNPHNAELVTRYTGLFPAGKGLTQNASGSAELVPEVAVEELTQFLRLHDIAVEWLEEKLQEICTVLAKKDGVRSFFLNVKGPELLDKYVGETEHRIRKIFEEARRHATYFTPVVIFFDEMEAMFRTRGTGRSSDVETTIVPQFLSELDGVESTSNLIIIGASNRQDMIDPAILRPKRLDVKVKVDRPTRKSAQDILAMYLLPTLPLSPEGMTVTAPEGAVGEVVFRTAYQRADNSSRITGSVDGAYEMAKLLPPGCDFRLALSLQPDELDQLAKFPATATIRDALLLEKERTDELPWEKLRRFKPGLEIGDVVTRLRSISPDQSVKNFIQREWLAEAMILEAVALLYSSSSIVSVLTGNGNRYTFPLRDFMSGAIIANIADRAKRQAIKRVLVEQRAARAGAGISLDDVHKALLQEFEENKEQLALHKLNTDMGKAEDIQFVEIHLKAGEVDPWSEDKVRLYKGTSPLRR